MLKIRLQRIGRRHDPQFRVVLTDGRRGPKSGGFKEILGSYNAKSGDITLDADRITYWLGVGAQASDTVHNFLVDKEIVKADKINALPKKTPIVTEKPVEEAPATAPAETSAEEVASEAEAEQTSEAPAEEAPAEEAPAEEAPAEEAPALEKTEEDV
ncbi:30S ribosomal protein S16 [Candidatus Nomurabacteria bacterium]|nr:30S ribosomal protein S16 [Candidatus Nomurabacteria bacterium]